MSLTKEQKKDAVAQVQDAVSGATSVVFITFDGLTVDDVTELRGQLFTAGMHMRVVPKRLLKLVMKNTNLDFDPKAHQGQIAVVWGADPVAPAKVLHDFAKTHEAITLTAGVLAKNMLTREQVVALAQLPTRDQLLGQLVGVLAGPMRSLAVVLSGVPRATVYVLTAIKDKKTI